MFRVVLNIVQAVPHTNLVGQNVIIELLLNAKHDVNRCVIYTEYYSSWRCMKCSVTVTKQSRGQKLQQRYR